MEGSVEMLCLYRIFPDFQGPIALQDPGSFHGYPIRVHDSAIGRDKLDQVLGNSPNYNFR